MRFTTPAPSGAGVVLVLPDADQARSNLTPKPLKTMNLPADSLRRTACRRAPKQDTAMTDDQIKLVQDTFALVEPIADDAAALFYERLFTLDPTLKSLFRGDMKQQGQMLMQTIGLAVHDLRQPANILRRIEQMGQRHVSYGVTEAHYDTVGEALMWTLSHGLGEAFTPAVRDAWATTYNLLAEVMKTGARRAAA